MLRGSQLESDRLLEGHAARVELAGRSLKGQLITAAKNDGVEDPDIAS